MCLQACVTYIRPFVSYYIVHRFWFVKQVHQRTEDASGLRNPLYGRSRVSALFFCFLDPSKTSESSLTPSFVSHFWFLSVENRMLNGDGSTEQTDIWAVGVIAFVLLSGTYPFLRGSHDLEDEERKALLKDARFRFGPEWEERLICTAAKDFVAQCFQKDPVDRWSAAEALDFVQGVWIPHLESLEKWNEQGQLSLSKSLSKEVSFDEQALETPTKVLASPHTKRETLTRSVGSKRSLMRMDLKMVKGMQKYGKCKFSDNDSLLLICNYISFHPTNCLGCISPRYCKSRFILYFNKTLLVEYSELKKTILMTMAYTMDKTSLHELRDIFVVLDTEASGTVTLVDLKKALQQVHSDRHMNDETIEKLFHGIDGESDAV